MSLERPDLMRVLALELFYTGTGGTTVVERFCSASAPLTVGSFDYLPDPALAADLPVRTGIVEEEDTEVSITNQWGSINSMALGRAFAPVIANLLEFVFDPSQVPLSEVDILHLAEGRVALIQENLPDAPGVSVLTIRSAKNDLDHPLDSVAVDTCRNTFGSTKTCKFDLGAALDSSGSMTAISGISVTITGLPPVPFGWWERGFVAFGGVRIGIRSWKDGTTFKLMQLPPKYWIETVAVSGPQSVDISPGCPLTLSGCRERNREASFRGLGVNIPYFHPNFETPA